MKRVVIIDDHAIVREGLKRALHEAGYDVVSEAATQAQARLVIAQVNPDVIVVDLNLPDGSGFDIITWARKLSTTLGIVVLTLSHDDGHLIGAMQAGASAFVSKSAPMVELLAAIEFSTKSPLSFSAKGLSRAIKTNNDGFHLTPREFDVLALLPTGATTEMIALSLFVSQSTIKTHLASIFRKLEVANRTAAVNKARMNNLVL